MLCDQGKSALGTEDAERRGPGIGIDSLARHHGDRYRAGEAHPGDRIDDVGIFHAGDLQILLAIAGGGNCCVAEFQHAREWGRRIVRINANSPAAFPGRRIANGQIAAGCHQGAADTEFRQCGERLAGKRPGMAILGRLSRLASLVDRRETG
jgi:hypothetical protein